MYGGGYAHSYFLLMIPITQDIEGREAVPFLKNGKGEVSGSTKASSEESCTNGQIRSSSSSSSLRYHGSGGELFAARIVVLLIACFECCSILPHLAITMTFKEMHNFSPIQTATMYAFLKVPFILQPVFAIATDALPIFGRRRKPYLMFSSLLAFFSLLGLSFWHDTFHPFHLFLCLFIFYLSVSLTVAVRDGLLVEISRKSVPANEICATFAARKCFAAILHVIGGAAIVYSSIAQMFLLTSFLPLCLFIVTLFLREEKKKDCIAFNLNEHINSVKEELSKSWIYKYQVFMILSMALPSTGYGMFYYMVDQLSMSYLRLGVINASSHIGAMLGILLFLYTMQHVNIRTLILWTSVVAIPFYLAPLIVILGFNDMIGIPATWLIATDYGIKEVLWELQLVPLLIMSASACGKNIEASLLTSLSFILSIGVTLNNIISAGTMFLLNINANDPLDIVNLIVICSMTSIIPLGFLFLLPDCSVHAFSQIPTDITQKNAL